MDRTDTVSLCYSIASIEDKKLTAANIFFNAD